VRNEKGKTQAEYIIAHILELQKESFANGGIVIYNGYYAHNKKKGST
jgi:hypothetical protein